MQVNESIIDLVGSFALKKFKFDDDSHVIADCYLESDDSKVLAPIVFQRYGRRLSDIDVCHIIHEAQSTTIVPCDNLLLCEINGGTIVDLIVDNGQKLRILYLGGNEFCLLRDSADAFEPMDILQSLSLRLDLYGDAYFRIIRNGSPFPDESRLFVCHIHKMEIERGRIRINKQIPPKTECKTSASIVYAWKVSKGYQFTQEDLTECDGALFTINVKDMTYVVNRHYDNELSCYKDLGQVFHDACKVKRQGTGLETLQKGRINFFGNSFIIIQKAIVGV